MTSPSTSTDPDTPTPDPDPPATPWSGGHSTGQARYALHSHTHETPALPRWVRYLAAVLGALVVVVGVLGVVILRELDARVAEVNAYVAEVRAYIEERRDARDAERVEDLERSRLLVCDLLVTADPPVTEGRQDAIDRLACPPAGDPAYEQLGE